MSTQTRGPDGRFPAGRSGNTKGRPRKEATVSAAILSAINKTVTANTDHGRKRKMRKLDATATQVANKGASGDLRAAKMVLDMAAKAEALEATRAVPETLFISDQEILEQFLADYRRHLEEGDQ
jgi:hypothetical protein